MIDKSVFIVSTLQSNTKIMNENFDNTSNRVRSFFTVFSSFLEIIIHIYKSDSVSVGRADEISREEIHNYTRTNKGLMVQKIITIEFSFDESVTVINTIFIERNYDPKFTKLNKDFVHNYDSDGNPCKTSFKRERG
jgi:hypothetical protein